MKKKFDLAFIRNKLAVGKFEEKDWDLLNEFKQKVMDSDTPFKELALNVLNNCEQDIKNSDFFSATQEIQLIHNLSFEDFGSWNQNYFYTIELLSYIEQINDASRVKKLISILAKIIKFE